MRSKATPRKIPRADARQREPAQGKTVRRQWADISQYPPTQLTPCQSKEMPRKRTAENSASEASQRNVQDAAERSIEAQQRRVGPWSCMRDTLDIDFAHYDAAEVARRWHLLLRGTTGEDEYSEPDALNPPLPAEISPPVTSMTASEYEQQIQAWTTVAKAATAARRSVAIPDDEVAQLGLNSEVSKEGAVPEAAKLFWDDEELIDVGEGRFYPSRYVREEGDMPLEEWTQKEKEGVLPEGDYDVTAVVDERRRPHARAREYIVKWKGFELNPEQWLPSKMLEPTVAMAEWVKKRAAAGQ